MNLGNSSGSTIIFKKITVLYLYLTLFTETSPGKEQFYWIPFTMFPLYIPRTRPFQWTHLLLEPQFQAPETFMRTLISFLEPIWISFINPSTSWMTCSSVPASLSWSQWTFGLGYGLLGSVSRALSWRGVRLDWGASEWCVKPAASAWAVSPCVRFCVETCLRHALQTLGNYGRVTHHKFEGLSILLHVVKFVNPIVSKKNVNNTTLSFLCLKLLFGLNSET